MAIEIERKFLVDMDKWNALDKPQGTYLVQGYISTDPNKTVRVRIAGEKAFLTIKGISTGASRAEFEYGIPVEEAREMLTLFAANMLAKTRYKIMFEGKLWEVDVFHDRNQGLVVAEIELASETETFALPPWVFDEVTGQQRYFNSYLVQHPYEIWSQL